MNKVLTISAILGLFTLVSCGGGEDPLKKVPRCLSAEEARNICRAVYIVDGFTLEQASLRCDPFYLNPGCYNSEQPSVK